MSAAKSPGSMSAIEAFTAGPANNSAAPRPPPHPLTLWRIVNSVRSLRLRGEGVRFIDPSLSRSFRRCLCYMSSIAAEKAVAQ
jgi:hypothetical protein